MIYRYRKQKIQYKAKYFIIYNIGDQVSYVSVTRSSFRGGMDGGVLRKGYHCKILTGEATRDSQLPLTRGERLCREPITGVRQNPYSIDETSTAKGPCPPLLPVQTYPSRTTSGKFAWAQSWGGAALQALQGLSYPKYERRVLPPNMCGLSHA